MRRKQRGALFSHMVTGANSDLTKDSITRDEIYDYIALLIGGAPTLDKTGEFPDRNIDSVFSILLQSFEGARAKLGEERYAAVVDLAARMKALCAADPEDNNGKTNEGYKLIWEMEDVIQTARRRRVKAKLPDDEGEVTAD